MTEPDGIDEMLDQIEEKIFEKEKTKASLESILAACAKAMTKSIDNADRPVHLVDWVKLSPFDSRGRKVHPAYLFEPPNVRAVVLSLVKSGRVRRLGQMTFYSKRAVERIDGVIARLLRHGIICDLETIADMITEDAKQDVICEKVVGFLEEEILRQAVENSKAVTRNADGDIYHRTLIQTVAEHVIDIGRVRAREPMTPEDLFKLAARFTDNKTYIWEALHNPSIRESVVERLRKIKTVAVSKTGRLIKFNPKKGKVPTVTERFRSLDDE